MRSSRAPTSNRASRSAAAPASTASTLRAPSDSRCALPSYSGECYCDLEYDPGEQNGLCGGSCPESTSGCNIPCAGDTSEMCGSAWFNMVYKVECSGGAAAWTWPFIIGFCAM
jgi:hypothetical protein